MIATKYRKKPVEIEAIRFDGTQESAIAIGQWSAEGVIYTPKNYTSMTVATLEGIMTVSVGDYVIRGVQGEFYPCKPDIFAATYEEVR